MSSSVRQSRPYRQPSDDTVTAPAAAADVADPRPLEQAFASDALAGLDPDAWTALARIGRSLHVKDGDLQTTLEAVLAGAARTVNGTRDAGLNLLVRGKFVPQVIHGSAPPLLDALQQRLGDGPCVAASRDQTVVEIQDMRTERRWREFAELAVSLDVLAMLCVPLWVDDLRLGSLSLYAASVDGYHDHEVQVASLFATHAAVAIADAQRTHNLRLALTNRDVIGQAKGVLMERHRVTSEQAFQMLTKASQLTNRKLADVAEELTATGELPRTDR